jgi:hypothetical protein
MKKPPGMIVSVLPPGLIREGPGTTAYQWLDSRYGRLNRWSGRGRSDLERTLLLAKEGAMCLPNENRASGPPSAGVFLRGSADGPAPMSAAFSSSFLL